MTNPVAMDVVRITRLHGTKNTAAAITRLNGNRAQYLLLSMLVISLLAGCGNPAPREGISPLAPWADKWVIMNYWAEWCGPCLEEIPELNNLQQKHGERVAVLGVNFDNIRGEALQALAKKMGIAFPLLEQDPADWLRLSRPSALPTTYIFYPGGELAAVLVGPQTAQELLERIARLAAGAPRGPVARHSASIARN